MCNINKYTNNSFKTLVRLKSFDDTCNSWIRANLVLIKRNKGSLFIKATNEWTTKH